MTNLVEAARDGLFALVQRVCVATGLDPARIDRNPIIGEEGDGADDDDRGQDRRRPGAAHPLWIRITVEDTAEDSIEVTARTLGVARYDLRLTADVMASITGAAITGADEAHARALLAGFGQALAAELETDFTLGGTCMYAALEDGGTPAQARQAGQEMRAEVWSVMIDIGGATTPRG